MEATKSELRAQLAAELCSQLGRLDKLKDDKAEMMRECLEKKKEIEYRIRELRDQIDSGNIQPEIFPRDPTTEKSEASNERTDSEGIPW